MISLGLLIPTTHLTTKARMLTGSDLAVWTGVIGAAVGGTLGLGGAVIQGRITQSEGRESRAHEREMRLGERQAKAYLDVMDYAGRLVGWMEGYEVVALATGGPSIWSGSGHSLWTGDEWYRMMAGLRAFGTKAAQRGFLELHEAGTSLNSLIKVSQSTNVTKPQMVDACALIRTKATELQHRLQKELQVD